MNEISIIINGVRYDAVEADDPDFPCENCDLSMIICESCVNLLEDNQNFKKSTKSFER